ncbi:translation initiation factor IF-2 [Ursus arctos]|uniref:translation initiation factor IF-2 n=1 Tax=Ursus arctos TaxID=9644 RepID=UPI00254877D0|nr:translation initiation factor IF-2 [Ursus arctos]
MGRGKAKAVCKQASSASLRDVRAGPGVRGCARPGPGANLKGASAPANTPAPHTRAAGWGRRPQQQDAPSARPEGCCQGPFPAAEGQRARDRAASHSPRAAAAAATAWPGGSSLSRQPPPEGTGAAPGAAAKPPAPEGTVVAATTEAQRPPSLIGLTGRRSHAVPGGAPLNRAGGARLRRDDRGAAGGDPQRSLQRRRGRSCRRRRWATAPPGPHARLRRRDCGGRPCTSGGERGGARPGDGGDPALATLPSARGPPPTMPRGRRKPLDPRRSWRVLAPPPALGRERLCTFSFSPEDT